MDKLADYGALGIIVLWFIYEVAYLQRKLFSVIENNTKALNEMTVIITKHFKKDC